MTAETGDLDCQCATALGWEFEGGKIEWWEAPDPDYSGVYFLTGDQHINYIKPFSPTTNPAQAMALLERIEELEAVVADAADLLQDLWNGTSPLPIMRTKRIVEAARAALGEQP